MPIYNTSLLKIAREQRGLTQSALADKLDVKQAVLSKYENGGIVPPEDMQKKISSTLGYPVGFFLQDTEEIPSGLVFHRKRSSLASKTRLQVEAEVRARSLDIVKLFHFHSIKSNIIARDGRSAIEMAKTIRRHWNVADGPIENLTELLEKNNIVVMAFDFGTDKLDGFFMPLTEDVFSIALNTNAAFSADRQRHTLAHELGHALLEHCKEFPGADCENEAELFAAELLTPEDCIEAELQPPLTLPRLCALKRRWRVSMGSLLYRAHALETIKESIYRRTWILFSSQGYRKKEPDCGIVGETPTLLQQLMGTYIASSENALDKLCLSPERFKERYPEISLEGQSMTPTVS